MILKISTRLKFWQFTLQEHETLVIPPVYGFWKIHQCQGKDLYGDSQMKKHS